MAGNNTGSTSPARGFVDAVTQGHGPTDKSGRGVPDEKRQFAEERAQNLEGYREGGSIPFGQQAHEESDAVDSATARAERENTRGS
jgi:hypothetical protein